MIQRQQPIDLQIIHHFVLTENHIVRNLLNLVTYLGNLSPSSISFLQYDIPLKQNGRRFASPLTSIVVS